jgi:transcriptional regulator with XRE-family HTH domain
MHEGERLRKALGRAGKNSADLANACEVSRQAVSKWLKAESLGPNMWQTIRPGLEKFGIEPTTVKEDDPQSGREVDLVADLRRANLPHSQLALVLRLLEAPPDVQKPVIWWLRGALEKVKP